jgi:hypothetical protein
MLVHELDALCIKLSCVSHCLRNLGDIRSNLQRAQLEEQRVQCSIFLFHVGTIVPRDFRSISTIQKCGFTDTRVLPRHSHKKNFHKHVENMTLGGNLLTLSWTDISQRLPHVYLESRSHRDA